MSSVLCSVRVAVLVTSVYFRPLCLFPVNPSISVPPMSSVLCGFWTPVLHKKLLIPIPILYVKYTNRGVRGETIHCALWIANTEGGKYNPSTYVPYTSSVSISVDEKLSPAGLPSASFSIPRGRRWCCSSRVLVRVTCFCLNNPLFCFF